MINHSIAGSTKLQVVPFFMILRLNNVLQKPRTKLKNSIEKSFISQRIRAGHFPEMRGTLPVIYCFYRTLTVIATRDRRGRRKKPARFQSVTR
jgi:hypothetical protein